MIKRFLDKFDICPNSGCFNWNAYKTPHGYGRFKVDGRVETAHRIAWEIENNKKIPIGMEIFHKCHNTSCVNPEHLELGTALERNQKSLRWTS